VRRAVRVIDRNMTPIKPNLIVLLSSCVLTVSAARAELIQLADGTVLAGELAPPEEIVVKTPAGERKIAFTLLPAELQKVYWTKSVEVKADAPPTTAAAPVSDEEIAALANEVNLETWAQIASIGSFRDKPEKRGTGGLVVTKAFNAIEENWVSVYSPKDSVGEARSWSVQLAKAKALETRPVQFLQKRWLENFIKAAEALEQRDSNEFALFVRELKKWRTASETPRNFFTAK
jgi:hypothetical protein